MKLNSQSTYNPFLKFQETLIELNLLVRSAESQKQGLNKFHKQVIRLFEVTHEQALQTMDDFFRKQGKGPFTGSRDLTVEAFHAELIDDGKGWLDMIIDRIKFNPVYPEDYESELAQKITNQYLKMLENFERKFSKLI